MKYILLAILVFFLFCFGNCYAEEMDLTKAVIHHTASPDVSIETIRKWHVDDNGWDDVGYHYLIRQNGSIEEGRPLNKIGAHAKGRNHYVGIALTGYDEFSYLQRKALLNLLTVLGVKHIERHHEHCPGYEDYELNSIINDYPNFNCERKYKE